MNNVIKRNFIADTHTQTHKKHGESKNIGRVHCNVSTRRTLLYLQGNETLRNVISSANTRMKRTHKHELKNRNEQRMIRSKTVFMGFRMTPTGFFSDVYVYIKHDGV